MIDHLIETHFIAKDADNFLSKSVALSNLKSSTGYEMSAGHNPSGALIAFITPLFPVIYEYILLLQSEHSHFFPFLLIGEYVVFRKKKKSCPSSLLAVPHLFHLCHEHRITFLIAAL